jgi:hypothetical protein
LGCHHSELCGELAAFLKKLDAHSEKEADVLQEAFQRESGGES